MYRVCIDSIHDDWYDELVTVNDGEAVRYTKGEYIETGGGVGVGMAKNTAMQHLLDKGCDYIILVEDDMRFKKDIFKAYIRASKITGIQHFISKHGISPVSVGDTSVKEVILNLKKIKSAV